MFQHLPSISTIGLATLIFSNSIFASCLLFQVLCAYETVLWSTTNQLLCRKQSKHISPSIESYYFFSLAQIFKPILFWASFCFKHASWRCCVFFLCIYNKLDYSHMTLSFCPGSILELYCFDLKLIVGSFSSNHQVVDHNIKSLNWRRSALDNLNEYQTRGGPVE